jgi:hypothetical protein
MLNAIKPKCPEKSRENDNFIEKTVKKVIKSDLPKATLQRSSKRDKEGDARTSITI